ncbi:Coq4-domain-containing protein, partial [Hypoxylon sp. EC38]
MKALTPSLRSISSKHGLIQHQYHVQHLPAAAAAALSLCPNNQNRISSSSSSSRSRPFSVLNRPPPNYPGHVPLTRLERAALAVGSGVVSLLDPYRHDMIAALGEATASPYFIQRLR